MDATKQKEKFVEAVYDNSYIAELNNQINELKHNIELKDTKLELMDKDILLEKQKNEILEMKLMIMARQLD
jgi:hypothetical protein